MKKWIQDAYNEWLIKYGYRVVTFKEQNTHNYTLSKLTKE